MKTNYNGPKGWVDDYLKEKFSEELERNEIPEDELFNSINACYPPVSFTPNSVTRCRRTDVNSAMKALGFLRIIGPDGKAVWKNQEHKLLNVKDVSDSVKIRLGKATKDVLSAKRTLDVARRTHPQLDFEEIEKMVEVHKKAVSGL